MSLETSHCQSLHDIPGALLCYYAAVLIVRTVHLACLSVLCLSVHPSCTGSQLENKNVFPRTGVTAVPIFTADGERSGRRPHSMLSLGREFSCCDSACVILTDVDDLIQMLVNDVIACDI